MYKAGLILVLLAASACAHATEVLRDPRGLLGMYGKPAPLEKVQRLAQAKIVHLNHALIRRDFPAAADMSEAEIEAAVLKCVAYISLPQLANNSVNTPIPVRDETGKAYRPAGYGRAHVFGCLDGLIDVKGTGSQTGPAPGTYKTGLFGLGRAFREELMERVVKLIFVREGYKPGTVENYGQIDLGFDIVQADGSRIPAGGILRQGHRRGDRPTGYSPKGEDVEKILRKYGMTSDHELHAREWQMTRDQNAQLDASEALFDFETIHRFEHFRKSPVLPDPKLELPVEIWSEPKVAAFTESLAQAVRAGTMTGAEVEAEMEKWIAPLRAKWGSCELAVTP